MARKTTTTGPVGQKLKPRGFAAMDPVKRQELARLGGKASQASGRGHRLTSETARAAGRIGGKLSHRGPNKPKSQT